MTVPNDPWEGFDKSNDITLEEPRSLRFAFYGRCSTEDNQDPESSRNWQLRVARSLIGKRGIIVSEFFDAGLSRSVPWKRRPEAERLLAELGSKGRGFDAIVVGEGQRCWFGSQFADVAPLTKHFDVTLWIPELGGAYDPRNSGHNALMSVTGAMSLDERQRVQERVRQSMATQVEAEGRWMGGRTPYGYKLVPFAPHPNPKKAGEGHQLKRLEHDDQAAVVVRRIFLDFIEGKGMSQIANELNANQVPCPSAHNSKQNRGRSGNSWIESTVKAILSNARMTGYEVWGRKMKQETLISTDDVALGSEVHFVDSNSPVVRSRSQTHPAIVSVEEFRKAHELLVPCGKRRRSAALEATSALQSLVRCGGCGRQMHKSLTKYGVVRYRCQGKPTSGEEAGIEHLANVEVYERDLLPSVNRYLARIFASSNLELLAKQLASVRRDSDMLDPERLQIATAEMSEAESNLRAYVSALSLGANLDLVGARLLDARKQVAATRAAVQQLELTRLEIHPTLEQLHSTLTMHAAKVNSLNQGNLGPREQNALFKELGVELTCNSPARSTILLVSSVRETHILTW